MKAMEPQLPKPDIAPGLNPNFRPEQSQAGPEVVAPKTPEAPPISPEAPREEQKSASSGGDPSWQAPQLPVVSVPPTPQPQTQVQPSSPVLDAPAVASDDDLIEQEWVQKAKKIVASTKDDPYAKEREVSRLQADYLQKRYGKELKLPSE